MLLKTLKKKKTIINNKTATQKDNEITSIAYKISQLLNNGYLLQDIPFELTQHMFRILLYIFQKSVRNQNDILIIRHYLTTFPNFIQTLNLKKNFTDPQEILHKISLFVQCEHFEKDTIIFINGEIGDKFYLIFKGTVSILVPTEYECQLSETEYIAYLRNLLNYGEYDLIYRSIESNKQTFFASKEIYDIINTCDDLSQHPLDHSELENSDIETYIKRIVIQPGKDPGSQKVILWKYHEITELATGKTFGEIALNSENCRRTATIIAVKDSYIGTIRKDIYQTCIRDVLEKIRKINMESILSHKVFKGYNPDFFERYYFNYFKHISLGRRETLFEQGGKRNHIYFIKNGEIEISLQSNMKEIDNIITSLGGEIDEKESKRLLEDNYKMHKFYTSKRHFPVYIVKEREILGMDDYMINDIYFAHAKCVSQTAEVFSIEMDFFNKMIRDEKIIKINYEKFIKIRKQLMAERLTNLKDISMKKYYANVNENGALLSPSSRNQKNNFTMRNLNLSPNIKMKKTLLLSMSSPNDKVLITEVGSNNKLRTESKVETHRYTLTDYTRRTSSLPKVNYAMTERKRTKVKKIKFKSSFNINRLLKQRLALYNSIIDKIIDKKDILVGSSKKQKLKTLSNIDCLAFDNYLEKRGDNKKKINHGKGNTDYYNTSSSLCDLKSLSTLSKSKLERFKK